ncbi:hypothetical protein PO909_018920 [Leuciscus waleckii]
METRRWRNNTEENGDETLTTLRRMETRRWRMSPPADVSRGLRCLWSHRNGRFSAHAMPTCKDLTTEGPARRSWTLLDNEGNRPHRRTALISEELKRYNVDIAGLIETRLLGEGSLKEERGGYTFFWRGYPPGNKHQHGVGMAIKNSLLPCLTETPIGVSERLMTLRIPLAKARYATLLSAYAPTLPSDDSVKDGFYQLLDDTLQLDSIGYKTRKHQDWFDENSDAIMSMLETKRRAYRAIISCPASTILRQQWQTARKEFHEGMVARVTTGGQESETFGVCTGLESSIGITVDFRLDGNLFNIRRFQAATKISVMRVLELQYADDCVFVAHTPEDLQIILAAAVKTYSRLGLTVNTTKTEVICQWRLSPPPTMPVFTIEQQPLTIVPSFKYLGSIVSENCNLDYEINNRIRQASAAFGKLRRKVFQNKHLQLGTKVTIYKAVCITTLLYSCEGLSELELSHCTRLQSVDPFQLRCLYSSAEIVSAPSLFLLCCKR